MSTNYGVDLYDRHPEHCHDLQVHALQYIQRHMRLGVILDNVSFHAFV